MRSMKGKDFAVTHSLRTILSASQGHDTQETLISLNSCVLHSAIQPSTNSASSCLFCTPSLWIAKGAKGQEIHNLQVWTYLGNTTENEEFSLVPNQIPASTLALRFHHRYFPSISIFIPKLTTFVKFLLICLSNHFFRFLMGEEA